VPGVQAERTRQALGLDRGPAERLLAVARAWAAGELGYSLSARRPVADVLAAALPATLQLVGAALVVAYIVGVLVALVLVRAGPRLRRAAGPALLFVATTPGFWLAVVALYLFHDVAGWLPASHVASPGGGGLADRLRHMVLPVLTVALPAACVVARYQLEASARALAGPAVRMSRCAGLAPWRVAWRDTVRPHLGVVITLLGLDLPAAVSGVLVVEIVFAWPGMGRRGAEAIAFGDYPLALAIVAAAALAVVAGELLADLVALAIDPRRRAARPEAFR